MSTAVDLLDPFPFSEGHMAAMRLQQRLAEQRDHELKQLLQRVARNQQTTDDIRRLAVELGIPLTIRTTHCQD